MFKRFGTGWLLVVVGLWARTAALAAGLDASTLRCEYRVDPLGVDVPQPRLSWVVTSTVRDQVQTAYRVLVASSAEGLAQDRGDLWDSGQVASSDTTAIVYGGKTLGSHQRAHWKVIVWDSAGQPSTWSAPAVWGMGMLRPSDWKAEWIGYDAPRQSLPAPPAPFEQAAWIAHAKDPAGQAPVGHRLYLTEWELPADLAIEKAELLVTGDDAYKFTINGELVADSAGAGWNQPRRVSLPTRLRPGKNTIRAEVHNGEPGPTGLLARLTVTGAGGQHLEKVTDATWKTLDAPGANWHNRPIELASLPAAAVVAAYGAGPWGVLKLRELELPPPALLRTIFRVDRPVRQATLYATALGLVEVHLNGRAVSDDFFTPGWTDYTKRVLYRAYDVTGLLSATGQPNVLGAILGDGWYSGYVGFGKQRDHYGKQPRARVQLHIEYADGTTVEIATGPWWKAGTGTIRESDFLMGETFDAQDETLARWQDPAFDDHAWAAPDVGTREVTPLVEWHPGPPVRVFAEYPARAITEPSPGVHVFDLGRNFAGIPRITLRATKPGQVVTLRFAERLNPDGTLYTTNYREARSVDTYICMGSAEEIWQPRFTFHGFQYVEVTGLKSKPGPETVVGLALASDTPVAGSFACSDSMLNQLHQNIVTTQRSNFIDIPTDCPQRDERLGWTGDAQVYVRTATLNADVQTFFTKWLRDLTDGQRADGQFPMVAPVKVAGDDGGPAWADAGVICPWTIYEVYGDQRLLRRQYPSMQRFIAFCAKRSRDGVLPPGSYHAFGDWLSINAETPKDVIYTAYFAYSTLLTARAAEVLGKPAEARQYRGLYEAIKAAFQKAYVQPDGRITGDTQAVYVLALAFDLVDGLQARQAAEHLVADIEKRGWHLSTGFIGTKDLMLVLAKIGRNDVAYRLLHNETFPSWGFSIKHGATSIWERWDGWTPEKGFQDPGMNSFAHYSFGAVYQWMVENIAGIRAMSPSYATIRIAPRPGGKLTEASTTYHSIRGEIASKWKRANGRIVLEVTVPANARAWVEIPTTDGGRVTESGTPVVQVEGLYVRQASDQQCVVEVGSGTYRFEAPLGEEYRP